jgi:hypothetical protein
VGNPIHEEEEVMIGYAGGPDGYAPEEITFWWVAIVMGVGVLIVVILLLGSLVSIVKSGTPGITNGFLTRPVQQYR